MRAIITSFAIAAILARHLAMEERRSDRLAPGIRNIGTAVATDAIFPSEQGDHIRGVAIERARSGVRIASAGACGVPSPDAQMAPRANGSRTGS